MKNQIEIVKEIADGMIGIGGIPSNEDFYAEFDMRIKAALRIHDVACSTVMIAVFCRYERDFKDLEPTPSKMFRRIRSIEDIRGIKFIGIIKTYDWYRGEKEITEAYDHLRIRQPELFE